MKKNPYRDGPQKHAESAGSLASTCLIAVCTTSSMGICPPAWHARNEEEQMVFNQPSSVSVFKTTSVCKYVPDQWDLPLSRLSFTSLFLADLIGGISKDSPAEKKLSYTLVTFSDRIETKLNGVVPAPASELCLRLSRLGTPRTLSGGFRLESVINFISKAAQNGTLYDNLLIVLDSDMPHDLETDDVFRSLAELLPCSFLVLSTPEWDRGSSPLLDKITASVLGTKSTVTICSSPLEREGLATKFAGILTSSRKGSPSSSQVTSAPGIPFHVGGLPRARVKSYIVHRTKTNRAVRVLSECGTSVEVIGFLDSSQIDNDLRGMGYTRRYIITNAYESASSASSSVSNSAGEVNGMYENEDSCRKKASTSSSVLKVVLDGLVQTSKVALCRLHREAGQEPRFAVLFPIQRGVQATSSVSALKCALDPLSLVLGLLPENQEPWQHVLQYTTINEKTEKTRVAIQASVSHSIPDWTRSNMLSKDTSFKLQKLISKNLIKELSTELERILDHAAVLGHRPLWLLDVLLACLPLSPSPQMKVAVAKWADDIKAIC